MTNALYPLTPTVCTHYISAFPFSMTVHRFRSIIKELTDARKPTITPTFHLRLDLWCSQTVATNSFIHTVAEGAHTHIYKPTNHSITLPSSHQITSICCWFLSTNFMSSLVHFIHITAHMKELLWGLAIQTSPEKLWSSRGPPFSRPYTSRPSLVVLVQHSMQWFT